MGYSTSYNLEVVDGDHELIAEFLSESFNASRAMDEDGECQDDCKWYDHDEELKEFSKKHSDALFKLSGEGEESGDIWHTYYRNGKMQRCTARFVFDEFDANKLK